MERRIYLAPVIILTIGFLGIDCSSGSVEMKPASGHVRFEIRDKKNERNITEGEVDIEEVAFTPTGWIVRYVMGFQGMNSVDLNSQFSVEMGQYCYKDIKSITGIGLSLEKKDAQVFSWEWYSQIDEKNTFEKLQGEGELEVEFVKSNDDDCLKISRVTFWGDHVLDAKQNDLRSTIKNRVSGAELDEWNCTIHDGSFIDMK
ncbi:MAG: hypothetical protein GY854_34390 [Deltaproteobacteria bacterium]|nr:hypothetical protein [Deltaproteobacteria bacterium]